MDSLDCAHCAVKLPFYKGLEAELSLQHPHTCIGALPALMRPHHSKSTLGSPAVSLPVAGRPAALAPLALVLLGWRPARAGAALPAASARAGAARTALLAAEARARPARAACAAPVALGQGHWLPLVRATLLRWGGFWSAIDCSKRVEG